MKKIRPYGTPERQRKKKDEEMVYICNNKPTEFVFVESYQASLKEDDKKESVKRAGQNDSDQKNENKSTEATFII